MIINRFNRLKYHLLFDLGLFIVSIITMMLMFNFKSDLNRTFTYFDFLQFSLAILYGGHIGFYSLLLVYNLIKTNYSRALVLLAIVGIGVFALFNLIAIY